MLRLQFARPCSLSARQRLIRWGVSCLLVAASGSLLPLTSSAQSADRLPSLESVLKKKSPAPVLPEVEERPSPASLAPAPVPPDLLPEIIEGQPANAAPQFIPPEPTLPDLAPVEIETVRSTPFWVGRETPESEFFKDRVLAPEHVKKLLVRARMELAAGDIPMAHAFAEAAAEVEIPYELFHKKPEVVLSEIEYVAARAFKLRPASLQQEVPPAPVEQSQSRQINRDPNAWRAIGPKSMKLGATPSATADAPVAELPERRAWRRLSQTPAVNQGVGAGREWAPMAYSWQAPAYDHNPLYFEDAQLERYGNEFWLTQPFLSAARFYGTIPLLPYHMGTEGTGPLCPVYDLGHDRPGDCVPYSVELPPFSVTGLIAEGGVVTGMFFLIP